MADEKPQGMSVHNYTLDGHFVDRSGDVPEGLAKHTLSGIHRGKNKIDRTIPLKERRDRHGRKHK